MSEFVPSFASFPDLSLEPKAKVSELRDQNSKEKKEKWDRKHGKHKRRQSSDRAEHNLKDRKEGWKSERETTMAATGMDTLAQKSKAYVFYSDRKGDHHNVDYGSLYAGSIPKYKLVDHGRIILGLSYGWIALYRRGKGVEVGLRTPRKMSELTDPRSKALLTAPPKYLLQRSEGADEYQETDGYLRLSSRSRATRSEQSYRSTRAQNFDDSEESDASIHYGSSESESEQVNLTSYHIKMKEIDQRLKISPTSINDWLLLLSHTLSTVPIASKNANTARSEITVSIISRCFAADESNRNSRRLWLILLKAGEEIWPVSKIEAEWESALRVGGIEIWLEWLEWRIKVAGGIDAIVNDAVCILKILGQGKQDQCSKVRVFLRIAVALKNAGFPERATAMFQAQAELTFKVPQALCGLEHQDQVAQLGEFWESEVPRVGEEGAEGWAAWLSSGRKQGGIYPRNTSAAKEVVDLDPYRQWALQELDADKTRFLPSRSVEDSDDPYSVILFHDVQPMLLSLESVEAKNAFRRAWLCLLGLHIPGFVPSISRANEVNWDDRWCETHLTRPSYLSALFPGKSTQTILSTEAAVGTIIGRKREYLSGFGPVRCWGYGVLNPLDLGVRNEKLGKGKNRTVYWGPEDIDGLDEDFVRRIFTQLRLDDNDVEWDVLALTFEAAINLKNSVKISRSLLSRNESMMLWGAHAQLEILRGRLDDARKVYQAVLIMSHISSNLFWAGLLWWNWAEMEWLSGNDIEALNVILRAVGFQGQGGLVILRGKRALDDAIKDATDWKHRECWIKMRALLELLANAAPLGAMDVFDRYLSEEPGKSLRRESLLVAYLTMLHHYGSTLKNPAPPGVLRKQVEKALEEFPSNSVIIGLFLEGERGQGVWGRVRGMLGEADGKEKGVLRRVEEVWMASWERGRWLSELERTRSGLAAAVESERTRGSYIIWRIYLELEIQAGQFERAKKILFRAIGECPLVKELYLVAFGPLREAFSGEELRRIGDTMVERGVRLRRWLDDAVAGWDNGSEVRGEELENGDVEMEADAQELRRLMPY